MSIWNASINWSGKISCSTVRGWRYRSLTFHFASPMLLFSIVKCLKSPRRRFRLFLNFYLLGWKQLINVPFHHNLLITLIHIAHYLLASWLKELKPPKVSVYTVFDSFTQFRPFLFIISTAIFKKAPILPYFTVLSHSFYYLSFCLRILCHIRANWGDKASIKLLFLALR